MMTLKVMIQIGGCEKENEEEERPCREIFEFPRWARTGRRSKLLKNYRAGVVRFLGPKSPKNHRTAVVGLSGPKSPKSHCAGTVGISGSKPPNNYHGGEVGLLRSKPSKNHNAKRHILWEPSGLGCNSFKKSKMDEIVDGREKSSCVCRRIKYYCYDCREYFASYQALGGHKTQHHRANNNNDVVYISSSSNEDDDEEEWSSFEEDKDEERCKKKEREKSVIYECPYCNRVFSCGQALGGHKRHCKNHVFEGHHCKNGASGGVQCKNLADEGAHCKNLVDEGTHCKNLANEGAHCKNLADVGAHCKNRMEVAQCKKFLPFDLNELPPLPESEDGRVEPPEVATEAAQSDEFEYTLRFSGSDCKLLPD